MFKMKLRYNLTHKKGGKIYLPTKSYSVFFLYLSQDPGCIYLQFISTYSVCSQVFRLPLLEGLRKSPYLEMSLLGLPAADVAVLLECHLMNTLDLVSHDQWPAKVSLPFNWLSCLFLVSMALNYLEDLVLLSHRDRRRQVRGIMLKSRKTFFLTAGCSGTGDLIVHKCMWNGVPCITSRQVCQKLHLCCHWLPV